MTASLDLFDAVRVECDRYGLSSTDPERVWAHRVHGELLATGTRDEWLILARVREHLEYRLGPPPDEEPPEVDW